MFKVQINKIQYKIYLISSFPATYKPTLALHTHILFFPRPSSSNPHSPPLSCLHVCLLVDNVCITHQFIELSSFF